MSIIEDLLGAGCSQHLEALIQDAVVKVNGKSESDICRFLPFQSRGYLHYFSFKKMKRKNPEELSSLIKRYILQSANPQEILFASLEPSVKEERLFTVTETEIERLIDLARQMQDRELLEMLRIKKTSPSYKKEEYL